MREPYDWDSYAETFFPTAQELVRRATEAEKGGEKEKASELYLYENVNMNMIRQAVIDSRQESIRCISHLSLPEPTILEAEVCLDDGEGGLSERPGVRKRSKLLFLADHLAD